jgi:hypothetical protein
MSLTVTSANYGVGDKTIDVTDTVRRRISNNSLILPVETFILGVDPAPGETKTLTMKYKLNNQDFNRSWTDRQIVKINITDNREFVINELERECADNVIVVSMKAILGTRDEESFLSAQERKIMSEALETYIRDCSLCKRQAYNDYRCQQVAFTKLMRNLPFAKGLVYPHRNFDWSYSNYIDNNYSVMATGATKSGTLSGLFNNLNAVIKLLNGFLFDANPASNSQAGGTTRADDYPYYECTTGIRDPNGNLITSETEARICRVIQQIKNSDPERPPADTPFLTSQPLTGQWASSYYVKAGTCPRPDITTRTECEGKNYEWLTTTVNADEQETKGDCYAPKYAYIDNRARGPKIAGRSVDGIVPSIANDFLSITPDKVVAAMMGKSVGDQLIVEQCPDVKAPSKLKKVEFFTMEHIEIHYAFVLSVAVVILGFLILLRAK